MIIIFSCIFFTKGPLLNIYAIKDKNGDATEQTIRLS